MGMLTKINNGKIVRCHQGDYRLYCILGRAESEREKLQYYSTWMKCYEILDNFLSDCGTRMVQSEQVFCTIRPGKAGCRLQTGFSKADTGGLLPWTEESNHDICLKYLEASLAQVEEASESGLPLQEWIESRYPEKNAFTAFGKHEVLAQIEGADDPNRRGYYDFVFRLSRSSDIIRGLPANQEVNIFISERYAITKDEGTIDAFIRGIMELARAVSVGITRIPLCRIEHSTDKPEEKTVIPFIWNDYGDHKNLSFKPNPSGFEWIVMDMEQCERIRQRHG